MIETRLRGGCRIFTERRRDSLLFLGAVVGSMRRWLDTDYMLRPHYPDFVAVPCGCGSIHLMCLACEEVAE
jgi:hypothetical protein